MYILLKLQADYFTIQAYTDTGTRIPQEKAPEKDIIDMLADILNNYEEQPETTQPKGKKPCSP